MPAISEAGLAIVLPAEIILGGHGIPLKAALSSEDYPGAGIEEGVYSLRYT
jgi:hypothetical protein